MPRNFECASCGAIAQLDHDDRAHRCVCGAWMRPWHPLGIAPVALDTLGELRDIDRMMREATSPLDGKE
jgi:hypothetical protein